MGRVVIPGFRKIEVSGGGEGGTTNYNDLENKPYINNVPLVGNLRTVDLKLTDATLTEEGVPAEAKTVGIKLEEHSASLLKLTEQLGNHTVKSDVPENAVFTDTVYDDTEIKEEIVSINSNLEQLEETVSYVSHGKNLIGTKLNKLYPVYIKANEKIVSSRYDGKVTSITDRGIVVLYDKNKSMVGRYSILLPDTSYRVFTMPKDVYYLAWEALPFVDFQIEMGDVATSYEPYNPYGNKQNLIDSLTTLEEDVEVVKNGLGGLSFTISGTTLSITDGTNTWTLEANS